jgi:hypothetical protein
MGALITTTAWESLSSRIAALADPFQQPALSYYRDAKEAAELEPGAQGNILFELTKVVESLEFDAMMALPESRRA